MYIADIESQGSKLLNVFVDSILSLYIVIYRYISLYIVIYRYIPLYIPIVHFCNFFKVNALTGHCMPLSSSIFFTISSLLLLMLLYS